MDMFSFISMVGLDRPCSLWQLDSTLARLLSFHGWLRVTLRNKFLARRKSRSGDSFNRPQPWYVCFSRLGVDSKPLFFCFLFVIEQFLNFRIVSSGQINVSEANSEMEGICIEVGTLSSARYTIIVCCCFPSLQKQPLLAEWTYLSVSANLRKWIVFLVSQPASQFWQRPPKGIPEGPVFWARLFSELQ